MVILTKALALLFMIMLINLILVELMGLDQAVLLEVAKIFLIALCIQPWVIYQLTN